MSSDKDDGSGDPGEDTITNEELDELMGEPIGEVNPTQPDQDPFANVADPNEEITTGSNDGRANAHDNDRSYEQGKNGNETSTPSGDDYSEEASTEPPTPDFDSIDYDGDLRRRLRTQYREIEEVADVLKLLPGTVSEEHLAPPNQHVFSEIDDNENDDEEVTVVAEDVMVLANSIAYELMDPYDINDTPAIAKKLIDELAERVTERDDRRVDLGPPEAYPTGDLPTVKINFGNAAWLNDVDVTDYADPDTAAFRVRPANHWDPQRNGLHPTLQDLAQAFHTPEDKLEYDGRPVTWDRVRNKYDESGTTGQKPKTTAQLKKEARHMAALLLDHHHHWAAEEYEDVRGPLYWYHPDEGRYESNGNQRVSQLLDKHLEEHVDGSEIEEIRRKIYDWNSIDSGAWNAGNYDHALICCENVVIDIDKLEVRSHSPDYYFKHQIPWRWLDGLDPQDKRIWDVITDILPDETNRRTVLEFVGHTLLPGYNPEGFLLIHGPGGTGKTAVSRFIQSLHGGTNSDATASEKIGDLIEGNFNMGQLLDAWVNVGAEIEDVRLDELGDLKALTGEDPMSADQKYTAIENFINRATIIMICNELPVLNEATEALGRRLYRVEMDQRFTPKGEPGPDKDPAVKNELPDDEYQMAAFLKLAVEHAHELQDQDQFTLGEQMSAEERLEDYQQYSDEIARFATNSFNQNPDPPTGIRRDDALQVYQDYARDHGSTPTTRQKALTRALQNHARLTVRQGQSRKLAMDDDGESVRVYRAIEWADTAAEYMTEPQLETYKEHFSPDALPDDFDADTDETETEDATEKPTKPTKHSGASRLIVAGRNLTGYDTVTVEILNTRLIADGDGLKLTVTDQSATMDAICWAGDLIQPLQQREGQCVKLERAKTIENDDGNRELKITNAATVYDIERGAGFTESMATPAGNQVITHSDDTEQTPITDGGSGSPSGNEASEKPSDAIIEVLENADEMLDVAELQERIDAHYSEERLTGAIGGLKRQGLVYEENGEYKRS